MTDNNRIFFIIECEGNPVPYKRTTQKQKFMDKDYHRYLSWKEEVRLAFYQQMGCFPEEVLRLDQKYYLNITIFFKDDKHADSSNVLKGIEDAIFEKPLNDKYVVPRVKDFYYDKINPRVEIELLKSLK